MMTSLHLCRSACIAGLFLLLSTVTVAQRPDDVHWDTRFGMPGLDDEVRAMAVDGDWLYVGGLFNVAGNIPAGRIARWNRVTHVWESLGDGEANGTDGLVLAIAVRGDSVYVGGQFKHAGGIMVENIAVWNKRTGRWGAFGEGSGDRYAYISSIVADAGNVYVGGRFLSIGGLVANNIARWDGSEWQRLEGGLNGYCYAMTLHAGKLYAGGTFTTAGATEAHHVAVWDGDLWSSLGAGLDTNVHALVAGNGSLYAGGIFARSGNDSMPFVARWDLANGTWNALRDTTTEITKTTIGPPTTVFGLALRNDSLIVVGQYVLNRVAPNGRRSPWTYHLAIWDGQWRDLRTDQSDATLTTNNAPISAALVDRDLLYLGGKFDLVGVAGSYDQPARNLVGWDLNAQRWNVLGRCVNNRVVRLAFQGEDLIVAGEFVSAGSVPAVHIVRMNDAGWHPLGNGFSAVAALITDAQNVYAGGSDIGRWDGRQWNPMPLGNQNPGVGYWSVVSFAFSNGRLYAGRFGADSPFVNLVWWDEVGGAWQGMTEVYQHVITSVSDAGGDIYLATTTGLFRWSPATQTLTMLGTANAYIRSMAIDRDRLYLGGDFTKIGGIDAKHIVMYDIATKRWSPLGPGLDHDVPTPRPTVNAIAVANDGRVYAGGWFRLAGEVLAPNIAVWDGEIWRSLGSGVDGVVEAIAIRGDDVYVGGSFKNVGGTIPSWNFAHWNDAPLSVDGRQQPSADAGLHLTAVPNPATGLVAFHYTLPLSSPIGWISPISPTGPIRLTIHDLLGREVAIIPVNASGSATFDTGTLPPGLYYCRLQAGAATATARLVVVR